MKSIAVPVALLLLAAACNGQGIRGVTRRVPTVVYGQAPSQFFAASGLPLNAPTNTPAIPGAPPAAGGRVAATPSAAVPRTAVASAPAGATRPVGDLEALRRRSATGR